MTPVLPSNYDGVLRWKENVISCPNNQYTLAAKANSSRIWLMFANATATVAIFLTTKPGGPTHGLPITQGSPIIFSWEKDGIAPTLDWYVLNATGGTIPYIFWEQFYTMEGV